MSVYNEIQKLKDRIEKENTGGSRKFLTLKDKDSYKIRFRQELATDGSGYDEVRGTGLVVGVHKAPHDFKKSLACTADNKEMGFQCWPCDQVLADNKWRPQSHLVINVGVYNKDDKTWETRILDQSFFKSHVASFLVEYALECGSITDHEFKISRSGSKMNDTNYTLLPLAEGKEPKELADQELLDVNTYKVLAYEAQEQFMTTVGDTENETADISGWTK